MPEDLEHLQRIFKMRIKYALEKDPGRILDAEQMKVIAARIQRGESYADVNADIQRLTLEGVNKAEPVMRELVTELTQEYARSITQVISQSILEMVVAEIERAAKGNP